ncbi:glycosyltransferase [Ruegeria atlantica]|uniref:glycosyltransferase n=1 Tax=Ruegeria atlantica TaxID=81569 RepID=UPI0034A02FB1
MRVLRIIPTVDPAYGGPLHSMNAISEEMARSGWENEVVTLDPPNSQWLAQNPVPATGVGPGRGSVGYTSRLGQWISDNAHRFDAAVVHGVWHWASVGGGRGCRRSGLPYVLYTHGMLDPYFRQIKPFKHWIKQAFWGTQGPVLQHAHRVLFTAQQEAEAARGGFIGPKYREAVVAYGASTPPKSDPSARIASFQAKLKLTADQRYFLFLSRIHPKKGVDVLIEAFRRSAAADFGLHLVIAGPDPDDMIPELRRLAQTAGLTGRVHFVGPLAGEEKWAAFEGAEAFTLITHQENFGVVLAEALAAGTPVIATRRTNIHIELSKTGAAIICDDTSASAGQAIATFLALTEDKLAEMRRAARAGYEKRFTIRAAAQDLMAVLQEAKDTLR